MKFYVLPGNSDLGSKHKETKKKSSAKLLLHQNSTYYWILSAIVQGTSGFLNGAPIDFGYLGIGDLEFEGFFGFFLGGPSKKTLPNGSLCLWPIRSCHMVSKTCDLFWAFLSFLRYVNVYGCKWTNSELFNYKFD